MPCWEAVAAAEMVTTALRPPPTRPRPEPLVLRSYRRVPDGTASSTGRAGATTPPRSGARPSNLASLPRFGRPCPARGAGGSRIRPRQPGGKIGVVPRKRSRAMRPGARETVLGLADRVARVREQRTAALDQAADVVGVAVREEHEVERFGRETWRRRLVDEPTAVVAWHGAQMLAVEVTNVGVQVAVICRT